jgi:hypothetical protein
MGLIDLKEGRIRNRLAFHYGQRRFKFRDVQSHIEFVSTRNC